MDIPEYPLARPIQREDKQLFDALFFQARPEISEFTFTNLYAWRLGYDFCLSVFQGYILLQATIGEARSYFVPLGKPAARETFASLLLETKSRLIRVPEETASLLEPDDRFRVTLDRNNCDYVYQVRDLSELKGARFDGKRNLIKNFKAHYKYEYMIIDSPALIEECFRFENFWCEVKDCDHDESLDKERTAFWEMLKNFFEFKLLGGIVKVDAKIAAVIIAEPLNKDTLVFHIAKANAALTGLYQFLTQEFLIRQAQAFAFLNMEQDLGIEGLRTAKLSYHPQRLVNKYSVCLSSENQL